MLKHKGKILALLCLMLSALLLVTSANEGAKEFKAEKNEIKVSAFEVKGNRHTKYTVPVSVENTFTTEGFEKKLENDILAVFYKKDLETIRVLDKRSGYIWGCTSGTEADGFNKKWMSAANSICNISYFDLKDNEVTVGLSDNTFSTKYDWGKETATCNVTAKKLGISFSFKIILDGDKLSFKIDDKSIKEKMKNKLASVSFLNFFGSSFEDSRKGYILVPDGSGALIRFNKTKTYASAFHKKVYGSDLGIDATEKLNNLNGNRTDDYATDENQVFFPIWGIVHGENQNGLLATIDSGDNYSVISAVPAGAESATIRFTRAYATFYYRSLYNKRVSAERTVLTPQEELNKVNPKLTYTFVTGDKANYSGFANIYREELIENKLLDGKTEKSDKLPLLLNVVGSETKKGFLSNKLETLTTAEEIDSILKELISEGITSPTVLLTGFLKGGYNGSRFETLKTENKVASRDELSKLKGNLEKQGGKLVLSVNTVTANEDQINIKQQAALNATANSLKTTVPNKTLMYPDVYYMRVRETEDYILKLSEKFADFNIGLEGVGRYLYSDYTVDNEITRDNAKEILTKAVSKVKKELYLDGANLYMLKAADAVYNTPVVSSQYVYETDSVPFLQMVLRGSVDYFAPYSNQGFYSHDSILKMIEYGCYPSFMIMNDENFSLYKTPLENHFSLCFKDWKDKIINVYFATEKALKPVEGEKIISHKTISNGVYEITYSNGCRIYVNYLDTPYTLTDGSVVAEANYLVKEEN